MGRAHEVRAKAMAATAAQKSKLYAKFAKEVYIAAKQGVPDVNANLSLRKAVEKAKMNHVDINFSIKDMTNFSYDEKFDVITCYFDSVNFLTTGDSCNLTISDMA